MKNTISKKQFPAIIIRIALFAAALCLLIPALQFSADAGASAEISLDDLAGKTAGVMTGTPQDEMVKDNIEDPEILYFSSFTDLALALTEHKIDYYVNSTISFRIMEADYPDFSYADHVLRSYDIGTIFPRTEKGQALREQYNEYISEIRQNGTLDEYCSYWLYPNDWETIDIPETGNSGTLRLATSSAMKPFSFVLNGSHVGFDVAVAAGFCRQYGYRLEIEDVDFAGCISGIAVGKYDMAAGQIAWTEERGSNVLYSDFYCSQDMVPIIRKGDVPDPFAERASFAGRFRKTVLDENRWELIVDGLLTTLVISLFSFILATVFGAVFCAMELSDSRLLRAAADIYSRIMQGTPVVVILMILYYILFGHTQVSGILVAIIGFGLASGASLAQLFAGSISGVDPGQREAALAIGFTGSEAFMGIVFPQALRSMLPGYVSQFITLLKGTAVVGYIAVADLTKAGDIIRSSTFEPFFPLIIVALIYFLIASIMLSVLRRVQKHLAPKRVRADYAEGDRQK